MKGRLLPVVASATLIRLFDLVFSITLLALTSPVSVCVFFICFVETKSPFFLQERIGFHGQIFRIIKFRTMRIDTQDLASHLVPNDSITSSGKWLRRFKLDEILQLLNVISGEMSLVGPRPNLVSQMTLTKARLDKGVYGVKPGLTGLAQIRGQDMSNEELLVKSDVEWSRNPTFRGYISILLRTLIFVLFKSEK